MKTRKLTVAVEDLANWKAIAEVAWKECDDRKLSKVEKVAVTIKALSEEKHPFRVSRLCVPLSQREVCAVFRNHMGLINEVLGTTYRYVGASYSNSGRGAFGRLGGGQRGHYNEPCLLRG